MSEREDYDDAPDRFGGYMDEPTRFELEQRRSTLAVAWGCAAMVAIGLVALTAFAAYVFVYVANAP